MGCVKMACEQGTCRVVLPVVLSLVLSYFPLPASIFISLHQMRTPRVALRAEPLARTRDPSASSATQPVAAQAITPVVSRPGSNIPDWIRTSNLRLRRPRFLHGVTNGKSLQIIGLQTGEHASGTSQLSLIYNVLCHFSTAFVPKSVPNFGLIPSHYSAIPHSALGAQCNSTVSAMCRKESRPGLRPV